MFKQKSKVLIALGVIALSLSFTEKVSAQTTDLIISEYVEGSGFNKYIEIFNGTGSSINLDDYELRLYTNGSNSTTTASTLTGIIADGQVVVYSHPSASAYNGATTDLGAVNFNGDDAVELYNANTGQSVDVFGVIGCDPGSQWTSVSNQTRDVTLRRNDDISAGVTVNPSCGVGFSSLENEWVEYSRNDVSGLGFHNFVSDTTGGTDTTDTGGDTTIVIPGCSADLFFSEYIEGSGVNKCLEIANNTGAAIDLSAGDYKVEIYFNGGTTPTSVIALTGVIATNDVYVLCDDGANGAFLAEADQTSNKSFFNGDDAVVLTKGGVNIDIIGEIGDDPGSSWTSGSLTTRDFTLVRNVSVVEGVSVNSAGFPT